MIYRIKPDWEQYLTEVRDEKTLDLKYWVSKNAPQKIKAEIRELDDEINECMHRRDFVFEGEDDAG